MSSLAFSQLPRWRQALALTSAAYALLAWALPTLMLPFVSILPFVHERDVLERLRLSALGSALVILALFAVSGSRIPTPGEIHRELRQGATLWLGVVVGFAMFTYAAAELSANILGLAARILPGENYRATVVIDAADDHGSGRHKSVSLEYKDPDSDEPRYLVLSRRLFGDPVLKPGDRVELRGARSMAGIYVREFSRP
jgi:hypothetical protein